MANGSFDQVEQEFTKARQTGQQAIDFAKSGANLESMLRESVTERMQRSPLFGQREQAAEQVLTSAPRAREDISQTIQEGNILSPTQQQSIMAQRQASDVVPLTSLNDLVQSLTGGVETAVGAGTDAFNTILSALQAQAQLEQTMAQGAFDRKLKLQELALKRQKAGQSAQPSFLERLLSQQMAGGQQLSGDPSQLATQFPGIENVSLRGVSEEVPAIAEEGTVVTDTDTGFSYVFRGGRWEEMNSPQGGDQSPSGLSRFTGGQGFLGGIMDFFSGGGAGGGGGSAF